MRWAIVFALGCTGCFGARVSTGPVFDSRGSVTPLVVGADAVLLLSFDVPVGEKTAIELSTGGGGGVVSGANVGALPTGTVQGGIGVVHMDERFGFRAGAMASFQANEAYGLGGWGGWFGMPILVSSKSERLFGSEEKGFGRSSSFTCIGPELDVQYTRSRPADGDAKGGLSISPRFVAEIHGWTLF